ncbi:MAG TPA: SAM-dependent methyltransferase [Bacteroidales bacterium]|nr:SAM-dependent methyltransferase [Bacteroidales bacterium]
MEIKGSKGKLYLLPSPLSESPVENVLPAYVLEVIRGLRYFIVEELRTARRFLKKAHPGIDLNQVEFFVFNEHSKEEPPASSLQPLHSGHDMGLLSEAGLPCIADPGSGIVSLAHRSGITVVPLTGPSSLFLALMASGFPGQNFAFRGYLPVEKNERARRIRELESLAGKDDQVQIFIETPYRNLQVFDALIANCRPSTLLCIASELTGAEEQVILKPIGEWKKILPNIHRKPAVFLLYHE